MILSESFVDQLELLEKLDQDLFEKSVAFAFNTLIKSQNEVRLADVLQIEDGHAEKILDLLLKLIFYLSKYRATTTELDICLEATKLSEPKRNFLKERLLAQLDDVRKKLFKRFEDNSDRLKEVQWRFQVEVASRTYKNDFKPNIVLDLITADSMGKQKHNPFACDYANLKNTYETLLEAFKLHDSSKHKKIIGSYL